MFDNTKNKFSISLGDKLSVEVEGKVSEWVVSIVGGDGDDERDVVVLNKGHKQIIIRKK